MEAKQTFETRLVGKSVLERIAALKHDRYALSILLLCTMSFTLAMAYGGNYLYREHIRAERVGLILFSIEEAASHAKPMLAATKALGEAIAELPESVARTTIQERFTAANTEIQSVAADVFSLYLFRNLNEKRVNGTFISSAQAQARQEVRPLAFNDIRTLFLVFVFLMLGATFVGSIVVILKTKDKEVLKFAFDTVKTLLGFFTGVATTFMSLT